MITAPRPFMFNLCLSYTNGTKRSLKLNLYWTDKDVYSIQKCAWASISFYCS